MASVSKGKKWIGILIGYLTLLFIVFMFLSNFNENKNVVEKNTYDGCFNVSDGAHKEVEKQLKELFEQYSYVATKIVSNYSTRLIIRTEVTATSAVYGGTTTYYVVAEVANDSTCKVHHITVDDASVDEDI